VEQYFKNAKKEPPPEKVAIGLSTPRKRTDTNGQINVL